MENLASSIASERNIVAVCTTGQGLEFQATVLHFSPFAAAFEVYSPSIFLRTSEVLSHFRILVDGQPVYDGQAIISGLVNAGAVLVCEVNLSEGWTELPQAPGAPPEALTNRFNDFLKHWQTVYKVLPEFKIVVADMASLLSDMRLWLEQIELAARAMPAGDRNAFEREAAHAIAGPAIEAIEFLGDKFEDISVRVEPKLRPVHIHFTRHHLHPSFLCSPFAYRTFRKPLGYAGDYEMVNMLTRDPYEGASLFAKVVNAWFLHQLPAVAHRNRIKILHQKLVQEAARTQRATRPTRILNLGCGPAGEVQLFLAESELSQTCEFTLLDFNQETLDHTNGVLRTLTRQLARRTSIHLQKKSVQQLLKEAVRAATQPTAKYDFVYCAGLFDYLPDRVCKQLMEALYAATAPGGLLLATNVDGTRPFRNKLEFILEWNLIYRNAAQMSALIPEDASSEAVSVTADTSGVNLFLEIRKRQDE